MVAFCFAKVRNEALLSRERKATTKTHSLEGACLIPLLAEPAVDSFFPPRGEFLFFLIGSFLI